MVLLWRVFGALVFAAVTALAHEDSSSSEQSARVAIVGRGLPAALAAVALREELGPGAELTLITQSAHIKAKERLSSDRYGAIPEPVCIEQGGWLHKLVQQVELPQAEPPFQRFAVFDGRETRFAFEGLQSELNEGRYRESWSRLQAVVQKCEAKQAFLRQTMENSEFCRWNASQFLHDTQLEEFAHQSLAELLETHDIARTSAIASEIVGALTSEVFNQGLEINAVAGCHALLQLFRENHACYDIAELEQRALQHSKITLLLDTTTLALRSEQGKITIAANRTLALGPFDAVLVTSQPELNTMFFVAEERPMKDYRQWMEFVERFEYVVEGKWQSDFFEVDEPEPPLLIVPENVAAGFVSIRRLTQGTTKAPSTYLLKTELPLQVPTRQDMFGRRSQILASFEESPALPDLSPIFMKGEWGLNPFPVSGHAGHTATQLQWLSFTPDFLAIVAQNAARTLARVQKLGAHSGTTNDCGGNLPAPVVIEPRKPKRMFIPSADERLVAKFKKMAGEAVGGSQQASQGTGTNEEL